VTACPSCGERLKPMRGANLDDLLTLLGVVRDALDAGYGDLAAMVLHLLLEHRGQLGLRSRNYAKLLREQMAEREQPPEPGQ
jgi:Trp operon repressor